MIRRVTFFKGFKWSFKDNKYLFSRGDTIIFNDKFNAIVGSQGSGKSTLIELIRSGVENFNGVSMTFADRRVGDERVKAKDHIELEFILDTNKEKQKIRGFNFSKELTSPSFRPISVGYTSYLGYGAGTPSAQTSYSKTDLVKNNCKTVFGATENLLEPKDKLTPNGSLIILDDPDVWLSTSDALQLLNYLCKKVLQENCQLITSISNPILIRCFKRVYDIESRRWIDSDEYLKEQLSGKAGKILSRIKEAGKL